MKIVGVSILLLLPLIGISQGQTELDSLLAILHQKGNEPTEEVVTLRNKIGKLYKQRNLLQALKFAEETIPIAEQAGLPDLLTNAYASAADLSNLTGDFKKGAEYADKSAKSISELSDSLSIAKKYIVLMNKGGWVSPLVSADEKIAFGLKGLGIYTRHGNAPGMATAWTELGNAYRNKALYHPKGGVADSADFKQARLYLSKASEYNKGIRNFGQWAYCITLQAMMEKELGFIEKAYRLNKEAIRIYDRQGYLMGAALPVSEVSDTFFRKRRYDSALYYINRSIALYEQVGYKGNIDEFYERQSKIHVALNDYKNALASLEKSKKTREEKYKAETTKSIMDLESKYENKLKEEKILTLTADMALTKEREEQNKIIFWSVALVLISALAGLTAYLKQRQNILRQLKEKAALDRMVTQALEMQLRQVQLQALQSQMNPHFIYNALSSIQSLILKEDKEKAITYLNDFAHLSRLTLENSRKDRIKLKEEIKFLQRYIELEQLRHSFQFSHTLDVSSEIDIDTETLSPMIIQPVVENAIKHGLKPKQADKHLSIRFLITEDGQLACEVDDNGIGRERAEKNKSASAYDSVSTELNEARLKLISEQQHQGKRYRMDIEDKYNDEGEPAGTRVTIYFSLKSNDAPVAK
ncbi:MAG TPA: histidine kinase [Cyclobacteriaceae bacterium]|nr:histidine kinase [Cyclobacteriaceae bacterium]